MTTALAFLLTLGVLIVVHEWGHYALARWCGVKVLRFSIGFGPVLWRRQSARSGTEFVVSALPLGGYVRMLDGREGDVPPAERHQAFDAQPLGRRAAVVAAGPLANFLLALLLFAAVAWMGTQEPRAVLSTPLPHSLAEAAGVRSEDVVQAVAADDGRAPDSSWQQVVSMNDLRWQVMRAAMEREPLRLAVADRQGAHRRTLTLALNELPGADLDAQAQRQIGLGAPWSEPVLGQIQPGGPAAQAGLRQGDRVLEAGGGPVADAQQLRERIRQSGGQAMSWRIQRAGQPLDVTVRPRRQETQEGATQGGGMPPAAIGRIDAYIGAPPEMVTVQSGLFDGLWLGVSRVWETSALSLKTLGRMVIGQASWRNLGGPLTIADAAGQSADQGLGHYLAFLAMLSVSLAVLNLLPLPVLDGGHLMCYLFEAATGRPVSPLWLARLQRGGIVLLLLIMFIALSNDVARFFGPQ